MHARIHVGWLIASLTSSLLIGCAGSSDAECSDGESNCNTDDRPEAVFSLPPESDSETDAPRCNVSDHHMCFEGAWDAAWKSMCESEDGQVVAACPSGYIGRCEYQAHNGMTVLVKFYAPATSDDAREMCEISSGTYSSE